MILVNQRDKPDKAGSINWLRMVRFGLTTIGVVISLSFLSGLTYLAWLLPSIPDVAHLKDIRNAQPSLVLTADGTPLTEFRRIHQEHVTLDQISPHILQALIATEDHRFYDHRGIDLRRIGSAMVQTLRGSPHGGSTITQQLARNLFQEEIGRSRTVHRKAKEMITALKIERLYTKQEILETYLNTVPFLYNVFGIEMAARTYYDKSAAQLNVLESATLVGMLKGTQYYNPVRNPDRALKRRNVVLRQMVRHGQLLQAEFDTLSSQPLTARLHRQAEVGGLAPHFAGYVRRWLTEWADRNDYDLYADGLVVQTTLDLPLQEAAEQAVERQAQSLQRIADVEWSKSTPRTSMSTSFYTDLHARIEPFRHLWSSRPELVDAFIRETAAYKKAAAGGDPAAALAALKADKKFLHQLLADKSRLEAGFVAMDPSTGDIKAWVGSRDFAQDQFDHVAQAARQPGSTFKPFVYGAALERGINPGRSYHGGPVEILLTDGSMWRPTDMDVADGPMTLREGLIYSKNTITAQVMQDVGVPGVVDLAQAMGVRQSKLDPVVSIGLGTSPVTLLEMVSSYATIATAGEYRAPIAVKSITDRSGKVIADFGTEPGQRVMSTQSSLELIDMLRGVVNQGTGQKIKQQFGIVADVAGKTGTSQNNTDGWFILMHPNLVAGAWVGFNDQRVTMRSSYWGQGGHNAILLVGDFFRDALKKRHIDIKAHFPRPPRRPLMVQRDDDFPGHQSEDQVAQLNGTAQQTGSLAGDMPPRGQGIIIRRNGSKTLVGDAQGMQSMERDEAQSSMRTAEELARVMAGAGRARMYSEGSSSGISAAGAD